MPLPHALLFPKRWPAPDEWRRGNAQTAFRRKVSLRPVYYLKTLPACGSNPALSAAFREGEYRKVLEPHVESRCASGGLAYRAASGDDLRHNEGKLQDTLGQYLDRNLGLHKQSPERHYRCRCQ